MKHNAVLGLKTVMEMADKRFDYTQLISKKGINYKSYSFICKVLVFDYIARR